MRDSRLSMFFIVIVGRHSCMPLTEYTEYTVHARIRNECIGIRITRPFAIWLNNRAAKGRAPVTASPPENKAHELLGQLKPGKLAAIVHLLEVIVHDDDLVDEDGDTLSPAEAKAIAEADEWSKHTAPSLTNRFSLISV
jgi:hypothetical protein